MSKKIILSLLIASALIAGNCAAAPDGETFYFFSKERGNQEISYITKNKVPFRIDIPGTRWGVANPTYNLLIFKSEQPRQLVNVFEYNDGIFRKRFYKNGFSEEQAIEEYFKTESSFQLEHSNFNRARILEKNISGPITPNLLWVIEGENASTYFLTASKNNHLISISYQNLEAPETGMNTLISIFRKMQMLSPEQVDSIIKAESE